MLGYPRQVIFETAEQIKDYMNGDKLICLECGKSFRMLGNHLLAVHKIEVEEYKIRHGIPWTYSLLGKELREHLSNKAKERMEKEIANGTYKNPGDVIAMRKARFERRAKGIVQGKAARDILSKNLTEYNILRKGVDIHINHDSIENLRKKVSK